MNSSTSQGQQNAKCALCPSPPNEEMISCTDCHKIFHKSCTNATSDITYKCTTCSTTRAASPTRSRSSAISRASQARRIEIQLQKLEEEKILQQEYLNKKYQLLEQEAELADASSSASKSVQDWIDGLPNPQGTTNVQRAAKNLNEFQNVNNKSNTVQVLSETLYSDLPSHMVNKNNAAGMKYNLNNNFANALILPLQSAPCTVPAVSATTTNSYTGPQVHSSMLYTADAGAIFSTTTNQPQQGFSTNNRNLNQPPFVTYVASNLNPGQNFNLYMPPANVNHLLSSTRNPQHFQQSNATVNNCTQNPQYFHQGIPNTQNTLSTNINDTNNLSQTHLSSRQSLPKELPIFTGLPEEWPIFSSTFEWSTNLCAFTEAENLIRLQRSLKGDALKSVQHLLIHPSNVPWVINILQMLYGQPEKILYSIQSRIKFTAPVDENNLSTLTSFAINVRSLLSTIEACKMTDEINNSSLLYELLQKLPSSYQMQWASQRVNLNNQNKKANLLEFANWIFNLGLIASSVTINNDKGEEKSSNNNVVKKKTDSNLNNNNNTHNKRAYLHTHSNDRICFVCNSSECSSLAVCKKFLLLDRNDKWNIIRKNNLCKCCLGKHHGECKKSVKCGEEKCEYYHHPSLHRYSVSANNINNETSNSTENIATEIVNTHGENENRMVMEVNTVSSLNLPTQTLDYNNVSQRYRHLRKLPISSYYNAVPKILIGLNELNVGVANKIREGSPHEPVAVRTKLGWIVYGATAAKRNEKQHYSYHICDCTKGNDENMDRLVKSFYSLESIGISLKDPLVGKDDQRALNMLNKLTRQREDKHYEAPLLWKCDFLNLPESYDMARKRLICLERKLLQNLELLNIFRDTISKYLSKGYIRKLEQNEILRPDKKIWYLPIFAVFNKNKPGKSRVVWDAAAKSQEVSLNSFLLKGPDLLASLPSILFTFRQKAIAICGDIEEMFHQIYIRHEDRDVQRFLWRDCCQNINPDVYVMDVMIFGASCAPSISQYIKNVNATKYESEFPVAVKSIKENHYVDDLLDSVDTPFEAAKLISDIKYIHQQGGFNIRNWISNDQSIFDSFKHTDVKMLKCLNQNTERQIEKVLGVFWEHREDVITFKISNWLADSEIFSCTKVPTKREVLRLVMSIYDPLGLIAHIVMYVKVLMQDIWRSKIDWDEEISTELMTKWAQWVKILPNIENIRIPRCYVRTFGNYNDVNVQLHTFVDASKDGYAAVCYFRLGKNGTIAASLVGSKTRVSPIKITSVPRLELMAALIGARFSKYITENHDIKINKAFYWSDSKTVLSWLHSDHRKYAQFVAFRVTEILELSSLKDWRWVPTKLNVADEATKWARIPQICSDSRWFNGPEFLYQSEDTWPGTEIIDAATSEELVHHIHITTHVEPLIKEHRFSKWNRMVRSTAYCLRFIKNIKTKIIQKGELTQGELVNAENLLYRQSPTEKYAKEIVCLKSDTQILKSSDIYTKSPYVDEHGVLRVDGRLDHANIPLECKHPVILHKCSHITKLILMFYHEKYHHINHETAINEIRQKFSISKLRVTYRTTIKNCQWCKIYKSVPNFPQMGKLPPARLGTYETPFTFTGLDFFGPIMVVVNRHKEKRYGCLFTCLTVRAVHIEVAHSLTTSSCILAIRNFMARRGIPREFFSDNGTNFIGAERELREALVDVDKNEFVKEFTTTVTKWNFNPPASPHMGGAWERLVRSVKTILYRIMPTRSPSDELLVSMLAEVENVINSRPLAYVPLEHESDEALTPNHFLVGNSSGLKPMSTCEDSGIILKQSWRVSQRFANIFWKKWLAEYLPSLTCRTKWHTKQKPICQGDLVVIVDPSLPRNVWIRGEVVETRLANDGQVRSAKVLTRQGILERPVIKLAILEVAAPQEYNSEELPRHTVGENVIATTKIY